MSHVRTHPWKLQPTLSFFRSLTSWRTCTDFFSSFLIMIMRVFYHVGLYTVITVTWVAVTYVHRILSPVSDNHHAGFLSRGSIYRDHCHVGCSCKSWRTCTKFFPRFLTISFPRFLTTGKDSAICSDHSPKQAITQPQSPHHPYSLTATNTTNAPTTARLQDNTHITHNISLTTQTLIHYVNTARGVCGPIVVLSHRHQHGKRTQSHHVYPKLQALGMEVWRVKSSQQKVWENPNRSGY